MNLLTGLLVGWFIASLVTGAVLGRWFRWLRYIVDEPEIEVINHN